MFRDVASTGSAATALALEPASLAGFRAWKGSVPGTQGTRTRKMSAAYAPYAMDRVAVPWFRTARIPWASVPGRRSMAAVSTEAATERGNVVCGAAPRSVLPLHASAAHCLWRTTAMGPEPVWTPGPCCAIPIYAVSRILPPALRGAARAPSVSLVSTAVRRALASSRSPMAIRAPGPTSVSPDSAWTDSAVRLLATAPACPAGSLVWKASVRCLVPVRTRKESAGCAGYATEREAVRTCPTETIL